MIYQKLNSFFRFTLQYQMKLKKINEKLREGLVDNGLTEANKLQKKLFSTLKSGADCIIIALKGSGKPLLLHQRDPTVICEGEQSPAL
jgi:superfamily II DNA/RNA helicase